MRIIGYWHICLINNYEEIIKEQLKLIIESGLYDNCERINIGCNGSEQNYKKLLRDFNKHSKLSIKSYDQSIEHYEFTTLRLIEKDSKESDFIGFYIHTKGVSFPRNIGGKIWRDYMNYYNIVKYQDNIDKLEAGFDTCGVKLLQPSSKPPWPLHYSGNFFWFTSKYARTLKPINSLNLKDRFEAEFWVCSNRPKAACLCDLFINYNTKEPFVPPKPKEKGNIYIHTLGYNLPTENEKAVKELYQLNKDISFKHCLFDLGFPLEKDEIPVNINEQKRLNSHLLVDMCYQYGSDYAKCDNIGVSQNWQNAVNYFDLKDNDIIIGADPDERVLNNDWVNAIEKAFRSKSNIAVVSLMMTDHEKIIGRYEKTEYTFEGVRIWDMKQLINWALIGISGEFLNLIKTIPYPAKAPKYGWLEHELYSLMQQHGYKWLLLPDYKVRHTDYPQDKGTSRLYRLWKNQIIHKIGEYGQISFDEYLEMINKGKIKV